MKTVTHHLPHTSKYESVVQSKKTSEELLEEMSQLRHMPNITGAQKQLDGIKKQLVLKNMPLVRSFIKKYKQLDYLEEDLFQEGMMGLLEAINRFDHTRGYKFSTVATIWIKNSINKYIESKIQSIRMPKDLYHLAYKTIQLQEKEPGISVEAIAMKYQVKVSHIITALGYYAQGGTLPLYTSDQEGKEIERYDMPTTPAVEEEYITQYMTDTITAAISCLPATDAEYIRKSYGIGEEKLSPAELMHLFEKSQIELSQYRKTIRKRLKRILEGSFGITTTHDLCS